jgi:hypothetical protein
LDAGVAQSVEQLIRNEKVEGSIPFSGTIRIKHKANLKGLAFLFLNLDDWGSVPLQVRKPPVHDHPASRGHVNGLDHAAGLDGHGTLLWVLPNQDDFLFATGPDHVHDGALQLTVAVDVHQAPASQGLVGLAVHPPMPGLAKGRGKGVKQGSAFDSVGHELLLKG